MYLDLEDYRPDTPRVAQAFSVREGILASLLFHALLLIAYLVMPAPGPSQAVAVPRPPEKDPVQFVQMMPSIERVAPPRPEHEFSDIDRRSSTLKQPPDPVKTTPYSVGDTREKVVGAREEKPAGPETGTAPPSPTSSAMVDLASKLTPAAPTTPAPAGGGVSNSLRNLSRYLQDQNFDNQQGGYTEQGPDIQFDSKGVEFGPWLRRFVAQVKRNWLVPQAIFQSAKVVIQFNVLRNGTITDLKIVSPCPYPAYNLAAFNALKNSNPVLPLPPEYPDDKAFFTVTFFYDLREPAARESLPTLH